MKTAVLLAFLLLWSSGNSFQGVSLRRIPTQMHPHESTPRNIMPGGLALQQNSAASTLGLLEGKAPSRHGGEGGWINQPITMWHERASRLFGESDDKEDNLNRKVPENHAVSDAYETLFGVPREVLRHHAAVSGRPEYFRPSSNWERAGGGPHGQSRGSNLFIKGMGSFEVQAAYNRIVDRQWRRHKVEVLWITQKMYGLRKELQDIPAKELLFTRNYDSTFHYAMKKLLEEQIRDNTNTDSWCKYYYIPRYLKSKLLLGACGKDYDQLEDGCYAYTRQVDSDINHCLRAPLGFPYWYVSIPQLWIEGYFPDFVEDVSDWEYCYDCPPNLIDALKYCRDDLYDDNVARKSIANILMADDGGKMCPDLEPYPREPRRHFIKHLTGWRQRLYSLEKLALFVHNPDHSQQGIQLQWPPNGMKMTPKQLTKHVEEKLYEQNCAHLDNLPDSGNLKVLRTYGEVVEVAKVLNNCAADLNVGYVRRVRRKEGVLVAYFEHGKPVALGMYEFGNKNEVGYWEEMAMKNNDDATLEIREAYQSYSPIIEEWCHQHLYHES